MLRGAIYSVEPKRPQQTETWRCLSRLRWFLHSLSRPPPLHRHRLTALLRSQIPRWIARMPIGGPVLV